MKYIAYLRTSTEGQKENTSPLEQERACQQFAQSQNGHWECIETIYDNASGKDIARVGVERVEKLLSEGKAHVVVFAKVNRIARQSKAFEEFFDMIYTYGARLAVADKNMLYDTLTSALKSTILDRAIAEYEYLDITEKTNNGKLRVIEKGGWLHKPIFGYALKRTLVDGIAVKRPEIVPDEARIVRFIAEAMIETKNISEVTRQLNVQNIVTKAMKEDWHTSVVRRIIKNVEQYAGSPFVKTYTVNGKVYKLNYQYKPILDMETALAVRKAHTQVKHKKPRYSDIRPLKGLLYCENCGEIGSSNQKYQLKGADKPRFVMQCQSHLRKLNYASKGRSIDFEHCPHSISSVVLAEKLISFVDNTFDARRGLYARFYAYVGRYKQALLACSKIDRLIEEQQTQEDEVSATLRSLDPKKVGLVAEVYNSQLAEIAQKIEGYTAQRETLSGQQRRMTFALTRLGIGLELIESAYGGSKQIAHPGRFISKTLHKHSDALVEKVQDLHNALKDENWKVVNDAMFDLGLSVVINFNEASNKVRHKSMEVVFDYQLLEQAYQQASEPDPVMADIPEVNSSLLEPAISS